MNQIFGGMIGCTGIDDTIVLGKDESSHDKTIINVLEKTMENNINFNPDKLQFKVKEASFFGLVWSPEGIKPNENKVKAITEMQPPKNLTELQSFIGMVNYLNRFSPAIAKASEPLRHLMKKTVPFVWYKEEELVFNDLKRIITESPVLAYYDPKKANVIQVDASMKSLGCILLQEGRPVCYSSRSLSQAEQNYSNIECELLATSWSLERFHHFMYGKPVIIETDHKPVESIWKKTIAAASPRLQRLLLRMSKYDTEVKYIPGTTNVVTNALSRVCQREEPPKESEDDLPISSITGSFPATAARLDDIRKQTSEDLQLCHLKDIVYSGRPEFYKDCPEDRKEYWNYRDSLGVANGLVLKGHRVVISKQMRKEILTLIHLGHMGVEKCQMKAGHCVF